jgi:predicted ester cyclase
MSIKENEALVRNYFNDTNKYNGDIEKLRGIWDSYFAPGFVAHYSTGDMDREQYFKYGAGTSSAFPDLIQTVEDIISQVDKVAVRISLQGTHKGNFGGIPATGRKGKIQAALIFKIAQGKFIEVWAFPYEMGLLRQLGIIPEVLSRK